MSAYPNPAWVADLYQCESSHLTERYRLPEQSDADWNGVVVCRHCNSRTTRLVKTGAAVTPREFATKEPIVFTPKTPAPKVPAHVPRDTYGEVFAALRA